MRVSCFLSLPVTLNFISLHITLTFGRSVQSGETDENHDLQESKPLDVSTYQIGKNDKEKIKQMATIVESLEKLGVLDPSQKNCYTVDKIVKSLQTEGGTTYKIGIYLYIKESNDNNKDSSNLKDTSIAGDSSSSSNSSSEFPSSSSNGSITTGSEGSSASSCDILSGTPIKVNGGSDKTDRVSSANSRTGGDDNAKQARRHHKPKLSKTQIMVIATCSTVIGVFFIVAVMMRIRNYIKRNRDEDALHSRPTFSSCSVALRGSTGGGSQRSNNHHSTATKSNDAGPVYNNVDEKEAEDELSPKTSNENRPLLIVTSTSAPPSPLPAHKDFSKKPDKKNECVKYIPRNKQSNYTNAVAMEDEEDMATVPMETPEDEISCETPGSQETLLDDVSDSETGCYQENQPISMEGSKMPDLFANCPQLVYEHIQRENSDDSDLPIPAQGDSDTPAWESSLQTGAGFSQSDNSLSDRNQVAYCYGNQVEYYNAAHPADEIARLRACSAPPTPEVVRKIFIDCSRHPHYSLSSECDVSMLLDEDNVEDITPISPSSQSPPVSTQAPSTSCQVTNSANQPQIVVQPPSASCHMIYSSNQSPPRSLSVESERNKECYQDDGNEDPFPTAVEHHDITDRTDNSFSDDLPAKEDTSSHTDNLSSITDSQSAPPPPEGAHFSQAPTEGREVEPEEEVNSEASDSEDDDSTFANLSYGERSFLLDPAFEGMEPTYV